jgi:transcriptional regulator of acetoin/glycerol metabolism
MSWQTDREIALSREAVTQLLSYSWPGNFRELQHVLDRAEMLCSGPAIGFREIMLAIGEAPTNNAATHATPQPLDVERLRELLDAHHWRIGETAKALGVSRWTLRRRLRELGLRRPT